MSLSKDEIKDRAPLYQERWRVARLAAKCESKEDFEKLAEESGSSINSLRNYAGVARAYKYDDVRRLMDKVPFATFEILRSQPDRLELIKGGLHGVADARPLIQERKAAKQDDEVTVDVTALEETTDA